MVELCLFNRKTRWNSKSIDNTINIILIGPLYLNSLVSLFPNVITTVPLKVMIQCHVKHLVLDGSGPAQGQSVLTWLPCYGISTRNKYHYTCLCLLVYPNRLTFYKWHIALVPCYSIDVLQIHRHLDCLCGMFQNNGVCVNVCITKLLFCQRAMICIKCMSTYPVNVTRNNSYIRTTMSYYFGSNNYSRKWVMYNLAIVSLPMLSDRNRHLVHRDTLIIPVLLDHVLTS